jgi:hypothetical protein
MKDNKASKIPEEMCRKLVSLGIEIDGVTEAGIKPSGVTQKFQNRVVVSKLTGQFDKLAGGFLVKNKELLEAIQNNNPNIVGYWEGADVTITKVLDTPLDGGMSMTVYKYVMGNRRLAIQATKRRSGRGSSRGEKVIIVTRMNGEITTMNTMDINEEDGGAHATHQYLGVISNNVFIDELRHEDGSKYYKRYVLPDLCYVLKEIKERRGNEEPNRFFTCMEHKEVQAQTDMNVTYDDYINNRLQMKKSAGQ